MPEPSKFEALRLRESAMHKRKRDRDLAAQLASSSGNGEGGEGIDTQVSEGGDSGEAILVAGSSAKRARHVGGPQLP